MMTPTDKTPRRALEVKDGWLGCPICRKKKRLLHVLEDTEARSLPVYCRSCKNLLVLDIASGKIVECRVQWSFGGIDLWYRATGADREDADKTGAKAAFFEQ